MINYADILREVAVRTDTVQGATTAAKQAALAVDPLTATQIGSVDFPFSAMQRVVLAGVARLVRGFTFSKSHPYRNALLSSTAAIVHQAHIPAIDSSNKPIVGSYGAVKEAGSGKVLTLQPKQIIESIVGDTFLKRKYLYYAIIDGVIYHTCQSVTIDVCTFSLVDEAVKLNAAASVSPLPDALFDASFAAALALMIADDDFSNQAQTYETYTQNVVNELRNGATEFLPAPSQVVSQNQGVN